MSWNIVLNKVIEIKNAYITEFGSIDYSYTEEENCLERWIRELNIEEYINLFKPIESNQYENKLLIRYGRYSNVFNGEEEAFDMESFFDVYDGFYKECRSLVIDIENDKMILTPFKKFRNINECEETSLENVQRRIANAKCIEFSNKLDGSMQSARFYNGEYVMAGSQALDRNNSWRLDDGYRMLLSNDNYLKMLKDHPMYTFIFEYISLKDAHVVKYTKEQEGLYLIGIRDVNTGEEFNYKTVIKYAENYGILTTKLFDKTLDKVMNELDEKSSDEAEGFVINIDDYRVKVKYNDYVSLHHALSKMSSINLIIRNIADNTYDDLLSKIPNAYKNRVEKVANVVFAYVHTMDSCVNDYLNKAPKEDKKQFMIWVNDNVPKEYKGYCIEKYLGNPINYIKSGSWKCPHYKKLNEMGVLNYNEVFEND